MSRSPNRKSKSRTVGKPAGKSKTSLRPPSTRRAREGSPLKPIAKPAFEHALRDIKITSHPALCSSFGYCMIKTGIILRALLDDTLKDFNIMAPQVAILTILIESGPMSQIEIGTVLGIDKATIVKLIDDLERNSYVTRIADKVDRRVKRVQVSASGKKIQDRALALRTQLERDALEPLSTNEQNFLAEILPKILDHVRKIAISRQRS